MKQLSLPFVTKPALYRAFWKVIRFFSPLIRFCSIYWITTGCHLYSGEMFLVFSIYQRLSRPAPLLLQLSLHVCCSVPGTFMQLMVQIVHFFPLVLVLSWPYVLLSFPTHCCLSLAMCCEESVSVHPRAVFILVFFSIIAHVGNHERRKNLSLGCN